MVVLFDTQYNYCKGERIMLFRTRLMRDPASTYEIANIPGESILQAATCFSDDIFRTVQNSFKNAVPSNLVIPSTHPDDRSGATDSTIIKCSRSVILPPSSSIEDYVLLYIGPESRTLTNVMFTFNQCHCYSFNPQTKCLRKESVSVNRHMMRRYYMIEKAKDAKIVGILVGTLGVLHYLSVLSHLKNLIRRAGKKSYTLAVGKLNVAKLANFQEVDVYVLVACPENTLLDSKEFFRPVVTPFELEVALNPSRQWSQAFTANFGDILPGLCNNLFQIVS